MSMASSSPISARMSRGAVGPRTGITHVEVVATGLSLEAVVRFGLNVLRHVGANNQFLNGVVCRSKAPPRWSPETCRFATRRRRAYSLVPIVGEQRSKGCSRLCQCYHSEKPTDHKPLVPPGDITKWYDTVQRIQQSRRGGSHASDHRRVRRRVHGLHRKRRHHRRWRSLGG